MLLPAGLPACAGQFRLPHNFSRQDDRPRALDPTSHIASFSQINHSNTQFPFGLYRPPTPHPPSCSVCAKLSDLHPDQTRGPGPNVRLSRTKNAPWATNPAGLRLPMAGLAPSPHSRAMTCLCRTAPNTYHPSHRHSLPSTRPHGRERPQRHRPDLRPSPNRPGPGSLAHQK